MHPLQASPAEISVADACLTGRRADAVKNIAEIFKKHKTDFRVVIGPNRRKTVLNPADLQLMQSVFGAERVHDYSFSLANALEQDTLLYDNTHYRPVFADRIMRLVYQRNRYKSLR